VAKTELFVRQQPGGMFAVVNQSVTTGNIFFVNSASATGANSVGAGQNPDIPFLTVDYAIGQCTASQGDLIYVMPGHAETLATATGLVLDVAGVKVVGLGYGPNRPTFTFSTTDSIVSITAANCWLENVRLVGDVDNIVTAISLSATADGCTLRNIELVDGATNKEFLVGIAIAAACHDVTIEGCRFLGLAGGATTCIILAGASNNLVVRNCYLFGTFSTALLSAAAAASANIVLHDNFMVNRDAGAGLVILGHATNTGLVARNFVCGTKNNTETISTPGTLHFAENYGTDTVATSGILTPSTLTAWS
jgi:hypothetical protein